MKKDKRNKRDEKSSKSWVEHAATSLEAPCRWQRVPSSCHRYWAPGAGPKPISTMT